MASRTIIRPADLRDVDVLARHRVSMFRDMGRISPAHEGALAAATARYLSEAIPRGEYLGWIADEGAVIGGAGVQLRPILPRPRPGGADLELGPEAIVLSVYVEPAFRRRGVAAALMQTLLDVLDARGIRRVVLHASPDGRQLYKRLGFVESNEMRLES